MPQLGTAGQVHDLVGMGHILDTLRQVSDVATMLLGQEPTRRGTALSRYLKERMHCTSLRRHQKGHVGTRFRHEQSHNGHAHHRRQMRGKHRAGPEVAAEAAAAAAAAAAVPEGADRHRTRDVRNADKSTMITS